MGVLIFSVAIAGAIAGIMLHSAQSGQPRTEKAFRSAMRNSIRTGFVAGALVCLFIFSRPIDDTPGIVLVYIGGFIVGPAVGVVLGMISFPLFYAIGIKLAKDEPAPKPPETRDAAPERRDAAPEAAPAKPAPSAWNPYYFGLVSVFLGIFQLKSISYYGHPQAWGAFWLLFGAGCCAGVLFRDRHRLSQWVIGPLAGLLVGWAGYCAVAGIGPLGLPMRRTAEKETLKNLEFLRGKLDAWGKAHGGVFPRDLLERQEIHTSGFFPIPYVHLPPYHNKTVVFHTVSARKEDQERWHVSDPAHIQLPNVESDSGWAYRIDGQGPPLFIWCTHTDSNGKVWSSY